MTATTTSPPWPTPNGQTDTDDSSNDPPLTLLSSFIRPSSKNLDSTIEILDVTILSEIVKFIGPYQFRFVAGINQSFRAAYLLAFRKNKWTYLNASSLAYAKICFTEIRLDGCLNGIRYLQKKLCISAAKNGYVAVAQYSANYNWKGLMNETYAEPYYLSFLQWLFSDGFPPDKYTCPVAASDGCLQVLQWASNNNFPWDEETCMLAAMNNHWDVLVFAYENGCPWDERTCSGIAIIADVEMLKWARENGCPWDYRTCAYAAKYGRCEVLQYARENNCPWDHRTCSYAAMSGKLEALKWARENGCPWNKDTCSNAAKSGHLHVLQWARANGCEWDKSICSLAAGNGHLNILQWAKENGCPWDMYTCSLAARKGHLDVLKWAHDNDCPCSSRDVLSQAKIGNHHDIIKWIQIKYHELTGPLLNINGMICGENDEYPSLT